MDDPIDEVVNHRRLPGEGEFDIPGYVGACPRRWATPGPWGVEVLSEDAARPARSTRYSSVAYETTAGQFERRPRSARGDGNGTGSTATG